MSHNPSRVKHVQLKLGWHKQLEKNGGCKWPKMYGKCMLLIAGLSCKKVDPNTKLYHKLMIFRTAQLEIVIVIGLFCCLWYQFVPHSARQTQSYFRYDAVSKGTVLWSLPLWLKLTGILTRASSSCSVRQNRSLGADGCHRAKQKTTEPYFAWLEISLL